MAIFEMLSLSTEAYDRGEKFFRYQNFLNSLVEYVLVSQHRPLVEQFARQTGGQWLCSWAEGLSAKVIMRSIGCQLDLAEIYARVEFPELAEPEPNQR